MQPPPNVAGLQVTRTTAYIFSRCCRHQTKLATQTSMLLTPFRPPCTPSKLASHASRKARTEPRSLSSLTCSSTSLSKEGERQAETSHCPSNNPSPPCTRASLSSCHPAARASLVSRFGLCTVRMFDSLLGLRHSSAAWASAARTWDWAEGCVATNDHSARRRRLLCGLRARKVEKMSEGEEKYHRQWASTVASKALPEGREER